LRNRGPAIFPYPIIGPDSDPNPEMGFPGMVGGDYDRFPLGGLGPLGRGGLGPFGRGMGPRFDPPGPNFPNIGPRGPNFPNMGPPRGGFGGGGGFGFM